MLSFLLHTIIQGSSAWRWLPIHMVRSATVAGTVSSGAQTTSVCNIATRQTLIAQVNLSTPNPLLPTGNVSNENGSEIFPIIKGDCSDAHKTKPPVKPTCPTSPSTKKCTGTREICRFTLPATPTYRKFMIGIHRDRSRPCKPDSCCHPGGGRPQHPDEYQGKADTKDAMYKRALSGELAEKIVDKIFKNSIEKGNPIIDVITSKDQLRALAEILHGSTLEREGCCYRLSGELKCFLAFLLLQRPTRRKRSCGCMMETGSTNLLGRSGSRGYAAENNFNAGQKEVGHILDLSNFQLPVSLYGFQPPPLLNLP